MLKVQKLRVLVNQRLTLAVEEIFRLFERTIADYEEEASPSKEQIEGQQKLLDAVLTPELRMHMLQQLLVSDEEVVQLLASEEELTQLLVSGEELPPEQQEWSPSLDQEDPKPPHIKEEQGELCISQEGEHLQGLEEADIRFPFTAVTVKIEDDEEEKPQSSRLHQSQTEESREAEPLASSSTEQLATTANGEDCGVSQPARTLYPASHLKPISDGKTSDSSELETGNSGDEDDEDEDDTSEPHSGLDTLKNDEVLEEKRFSCSVCGRRFHRKENMLLHMRIHTGEKPFHCSVCGKSYSQKAVLKVHMKIHAGLKPFICLVCGKSFGHKAKLNRHMIVHTGEKPFNCAFCGNSFARKSNLTSHMKVHTGEKPFNCPVCSKSCGCKGDLNRHMRVHTGEKPFFCSVCGKSYGRNGTLKQHMKVHTGEKPFNCPVCGKSCGYKGDLTRHMRVHTGEKPFFCSVCGSSFSRSATLKEHMRVHTAE